MRDDAFREFERFGWERAAVDYERAWLGDTSACVEPVSGVAGSTGSWSASPSA